jgi:polyphosphate kinase
MARNLKNRIEVVAPVTDPDSKQYLKDVVLGAYLRDNVKARELQPDGTYSRISSEAGADFLSQSYFIGRSSSLA